MSYIKSYGTALPHFRIEDSILHPRGKAGIMKAVCFSDEDIVTLAYEAASGLPKSDIDGILFATATPVYQNRYHASYLADLLHLPQGILALDFVNSTRSGTDALLLANTLIDSGKYRNLLVIASDVQFPEIGKELSAPFGHAACAMLVSCEEGPVQITFAKSFSAEFAEEFDYKGAHIQYDPRFSRDAGFKANITSVVKQINAAPASYDAVIHNSVYARMAGGVFAKAGFNEGQFAKDRLSNKTGNTGSVHALLLLVHELENGKRKILLADYTNGTNLLEIENNPAAECKSLADQINNYELVGSYQDYLLLRKAGNFLAGDYTTKEMFTSEMMMEREKDTLRYLMGLKCEHCGTIYYLKSARCKKCKESKFSVVELARTGTIYACTNEHYFPASFPPVTMVVADLDGGGRMTVQQTDTMYPAKNKMEIGARVQLVLRKMIENDAKPDYFWKARQL